MISMKENKVVFLSNSMSKKLLSNWNCNVIIGLLEEEKALLYKVQMSKTRVKITQKQNACTR